MIVVILISLFCCKYNVQFSPEEIERRNHVNHSINKMCCSLNRRVIDGWLVWLVCFCWTKETNKKIK